MRAAPLASKVRLTVESLERRDTPSTATYTANGVLTVLGTGSDDIIHIGQSAGLYSVSGQSESFRDVTTIVVDSGNGNDRVVLDRSVTATSWLYAGDGNDLLQGGSGVNHIFGGRGNDTLVAGSAADEVYSGSGNSILSGPAGANLVHGYANRTAALTTIGQQIVDLTNQQRAALGLAPLSVDARLTAAAAAQAANMANLAGVFQDDGQALQHMLIGADQPGLANRAAYVGYNFHAYGENIAYGFATAASVVDAWLNSPGHRANILNTSYTQIGVALATAVDGTPFIAQEFGAPANSTVVVPPPGATLQSPPTGFGAGPALGGKVYAVGSDVNSSSTLTVYDAASGAVKTYIQPFSPTFRGGVRVATGDVTGDGRDDIVVAPGPGTSPLIRIFDGVTGREVGNFLAYDAAFGGGVNVALGDVNGDGHLDIITGAGAGGAPHVKAFDGTTGQVIRSFLAYNPAFSGGVNVAAGDVNGDGKSDIVTGAGPGGGPHVEVFDGATGSLLRSYYAYDPTFHGGVFVAAGDANGDGRADIVTGAGAGGGPHVKVFDGVDLRELASFFAGSPSLTGGVRLRTMDVNGDGRPEILAANGSDRSVSVFRTDGRLLTSILAGDPGNTSGLYVG